MAANETTDKDLGYKRIMKEMAKAKKANVTVGVHEGKEPYKKGGKTTPVSLVAAANEFGTRTIPERSFMRSTFDTSYKDWIKLTEKLKSDIFKGKETVMSALKKIGLVQSEKIKGKILKLRDPANAPSTVKQKVGDNPLVDSRKLWGSIGFEVKK